VTKFSLKSLSPFASIFIPKTFKNLQVSSSFVHQHQASPSPPPFQQQGKDFQRLRSHKLKPRIKERKVFKGESHFHLFWPIFASFFYSIWLRIRAPTPTGLRLILSPSTTL
ncbi:hypothetical protein PJM48_28900, partial [Mycobacterium kansasii]